jgi:hypothetical protein
MKHEGCLLVEGKRTLLYFSFKATFCTLPSYDYNNKYVLIVLIIDAASFLCSQPTPFFPPNVVAVRLELSEFSQLMPLQIRTCPNVEKIIQLPFKQPLSNRQFKQQKAC